MALAATWRTEDQDVGPFVEPGVTDGQRHDVGLGDHRYCIEVEAGQRLGRVQARFRALSFDTTLRSLGQLMLEQGTQQPGCLPAFLVGTLRELRPEAADGWQAQVIEHQGQTRGVVGDRHVHAATPSLSNAS